MRKPFYGQYYASELKHLKEAIKSKHRKKLRSGVHLLKDNMSIHPVHVAVAEAAKCGSKLLPHPPYSEDLFPSDFFLLPKLEFHLCGHHFRNNEVIHAVEEFMENQNANIFCDGIVMLEHCWT